MSRTQSAEALSAFDHTRPHADGFVQIPRLGPELNGLFYSTETLFKNREWSKRIREIKRCRMRMGSIDFQGLTVVRLSAVETAAIVVDVAEVTNRVCQQTGIVTMPADRDGFFVERLCRIAVPEVTLDLPESFERVREFAL